MEEEAISSAKLTSTWTILCSIWNPTKTIKITEIKTDVISVVIMTINVFSLHIAIYNQSYKSQNVRF